MKLLLIVLLFLSACTEMPVTYNSENPDLINHALKRVTPLLKDTYNKDIIFYVNLSRHSGSYRFLVIDQKTSGVLDRGLTCNGITDRKGNVIYSNAVGSNASSKGIYKIGKSYSGKFGKAYKLYGLENTNSNAYRRFVVLHSYRLIPNRETGTRMFESQGCPTVSPEFLKALSRYIDSSDKPILLVID